MNFGLDLTDYVLEALWGNAVVSYAGHERDFLREIHGFWGINRLAWAINSDLWPIGQLASLSSVWIDHTPQCWYGNRGGKFSKPSCELADLLIIVWGDASMQSGRALLVQGKMASAPDRLKMGSPSTKRELTLLEQSPQFMLSNQTSVQSTKEPSPYVHGDVPGSTFCLAHLGSDPKALKHCTFLQIKERSAGKHWPIGASSWQTHWPSAANTRAYSRCLTEMVSGAHGCLGEPFTRGSRSSDWERLVNLLIDTTVDMVRGTAKGPLQTTASFAYGGSTNNCIGFASARSLPMSNFVFWNVADVAFMKDIESNELSSGSTGIPGIPGDGLKNVPESPEPRGGLPILFITPHKRPG
jgi:hypothetical protein